LEGDGVPVDDLVDVNEALLVDETVVVPTDVFVTVLVGDEETVPELDFD